MKFKSEITGAWGVISQILFAFLSVFIILSATSSNEDYLIVAFAFVPLLILSVCGLINGEQRIIGSLGLIFLSTMLGTTIRTAYVTLSPDYFSAIHLMQGSGNQVLYGGLAAITLSVLCICIAYSLTNFDGNRKAWRSRSYSTTKYNNAIFAFFFIGLVFTIIFLMDLGLDSIRERLSLKRNFINSGGFLSVGSGYLVWFSSFSTIALLLYAMKISSQTRKGKIRFPSWVIFFLLLIFSSIVPFLSSSRAGIVSAIVLCTLVLTSKTSIINWRKGLIICSVILSILFTMSVLRVSAQYRISIDEALSQFEVADIYRASIGNRHFLGVTKTALTIDKMPSINGYNGIESFVNWIYLPVPRFLWANKPDVRIGRIFGSTILGTNQYSGVPPGIVAELYFSYGWLAVIIGSLILGVAIKRISLIEIGNRKGDPILHLMAIVAVYCICFKVVSSDLAGGIIDFIKLAVPLLFVRKYASLNAA